MQLKQVIMWEPKRVPKLTASGNPVENEFVGKFRTKVQPGTPGAIHHKGQNQDGSISWDFYGVDVDSVNGKVRWVDVRTTDFGPKICLFLETEKALHQITTDYDVTTIHTVMNHLCGLGKDLETAHINISYWVRKKLDRDGKVKLDKKNKIMWARDLYFRDVPEKFTFDEWKAFSEKNNLQWFQEKRAGDTVWNFEAELSFWMEKVAAVQRFLLGTEKVLPFCWNSVTACPNGLLTADEIATASSIYEAIKPLYRFPFSRTEVSADSVELTPVEGYAAAPQQRETTRGNGADERFPAMEVAQNFENNSANFEDLPF